jgi:NADPH:quinone reductase-like Zn-dependent oxidoreductase
VGKALGAKLIGTVGNAQKAQRALQAGAWQVINYREESIVERLKEITAAKKCAWCMTRWGKTPGKPRWTACSAAG